ncbi:MAG: pyridoxamine kinase [Bacilli bacterium]|nr:pyridoxamine kinase [Bacilli bacterium]
MDKKILTVQDISCYGQCSITVALPILSALGHETIILPTSVLSTHTSGFKNFVVKDLTDQFDAILNHWKKEHITFDCLYTGYLGSENLVEYIKFIKDNFMNEGASIIIDPAMGDEGKLYPAFDLKYAKKMQELIPLSDIILPNVTEACFLSDTPYVEKYDEIYIKDLLVKLEAKGCKKIILTDVSFEENTTGVYSLIDGKYSYYKHQKIGNGIHGTGDVFSSTFVGVYLLKNDIHLAIKMAADFVYRCIVNTIDDKSHWYGVKFEKQIKHLLKGIEDESL